MGEWLPVVCGVMLGLVGRYFGWRVGVLFALAPVAGAFSGFVNKEFGLGPVPFVMDSIIAAGCAWIAARIGAGYPARVTTPGETPLTVTSCRRSGDPWPVRA